MKHRHARECDAPRSAQQQRGFTLLELMIVVVVLGIIAAIAYPSYQEHVNKSRRANAQAALMELAQFMERRYTTTGSYEGGEDDEGDVELPFTQSPREGEVAFYELQLDSAETTATTYTLKAEPVNAMAGDDCGTLTLTHRGVRGAGQDGCWRR